MGWPILLPLTGNEPWNLRKALLKAHVSEKGFVVVVQPADPILGALVWERDQLRPFHRVLSTSTWAGREGGGAWGYVSYFSAWL